jgi:hypothetical protein
MKTVSGLLVSLLLLGRMGLAAPKQRVVALGKWTMVKLMVGEDERTALDLKVRPLLVDGQAKEFTTGLPHEVTDRTFVVQRVFRLNDSLPQEMTPARWRWERGGWLLINRVTGKVQQIPLPEFDPYYSAVGWFRDYAAYCGVSEDGKKGWAIIVQLGMRKPLLKKALHGAGTAESECAAPVWQRGPSRVTFEPKEEQKFTFTVPTRAVESVTEEENAGEE